MKVLYVVNSFINRPGNIGYRIGKIIDNYPQNASDVTVVSRGIEGGTSYKSFSMKIFGHLPRIFNAVRIYISIKFRSRYYDLKLFEFFFSLFLLFNKDEIRRDRPVVHLTEVSPKIIRKLQKLGCYVILDVPIAPVTYTKDLIDQFEYDIGLQFVHYMERFERKSFELADFVIVPSIFVKEEIAKQEIDDSKISIVPFGVNLTNDVREKRSAGETSEGIDFCFAGIINERKGINYLLQAWHSQEFENDRLHLCGRLTPTIEKTITRYKLSNVKTPGFVNVNEYFGNCDVYVFPSLMEGSSKSIYEAMNSGMPVITTRESGSIIEDGQEGFIVSKCNAEQLREKMLFFKNNPEQIISMGQMAKSKVANYSWVDYADSVFRVYANATTNAKGLL